MSQPGDDATLAAAERLSTSMDGLREDIGTLRSYGKRNRHFIWTLAVSLVLDVVLSVAVAVIAVQANQAASAADRNRDTQRVTCESANESRAANRSLWGAILDASNQANPNATPAQRNQVEGLRWFVNQVFAPRDCAHLDAPPSIPTSIPTSPPR